MSNQKGITLIELLAVVIIASIVVISATSILVKGKTTYEETKIESELRDAADLLIIEVYKELYTTKVSDVKEYKQQSLVTTGKFRDSYIEMNSGKATGFKDRKFLINGVEKTISAEDVKILYATTQNKPYSKVEKVGESTYTITLVLQNVKKGKEKVFVNEVTLIE
jgi:prepilin-type N-terminal cleavage/methylation domain-containing protein